MELDQRRREAARPLFQQYERGLLTVEDLALELVSLLGEIR
jgi:hypothetical protein